MGKVAKAIGGVLSAPVRGIGHALHTSGIPLVSNLGGAAENVGNAFAGKGAFLHDIGRGAEDFAPLAGLVPGLGPLAGAAIGAGGSFLDKGKFDLGDTLKYGGEGALSGLAGNTLLQGKGFEGLGDLPGAGLHNAEASILKAGSSPIGGLARGLGGALLKNPSKTIGAAGGIADFIGANQQRNSAQRYFNSQTDLRNQIMSKILASPNYNFKPELNTGATSS